MIGKEAKISRDTERLNSLIENFVSLQKALTNISLKIKSVLKPKLILNMFR